MTRDRDKFTLPNLCKELVRGSNRTVVENSQKFFVMCLVVLECLKTCQFGVCRKVAQSPIFYLVNLNNDERSGQDKKKNGQNRKWGEEKFGNHAEAGVFLQFFWQLRLEIHL